MRIQLSPSRVEVIKKKVFTCLHFVVKDQYGEGNMGGTQNTKLCYNHPYHQSTPVDG